MLLNALKLQKVKPKPFKAVARAIINVNGVSENLKPPVTNKTKIPAIELISENSKLFFMLLPCRLP
jgi:hypothetical protein